MSEEPKQKNINIAFAIQRKDTATMNNILEIQKARKFKTISKTIRELLIKYIPLELKEIREANEIVAASPNEKGDADVPVVEEEQSPKEIF